MRFFCSMGCNGIKSESGEKCFSYKMKQKKDYILIMEYSSKSFTFLYFFLIFYDVGFKMCIFLADVEFEWDFFILWEGGIESESEEKWFA